MKRTVLTTLALSGALVLGACGTADAPSGAQGSTTAGVAAENVARPGDTVDLAVIGAASADAVQQQGTAHLSMTMGSQGSMEGDVDYAGSAPAMAMTMSQGGETVDVVYTGKVMYLGSDSFTQMTGGKRWLSIDPEGDDAMSRVMAPLMDSMAAGMDDPGKQLQAYRGVDATVTSVENGVTTYEVTLSKKQLKKAVAAQGTGLAGMSEQALKGLPAKGLTYTIGIDADGLPTTVDMQVGAQQLTTTFTKWGEPVDVAAPPASEVGTFRMPSAG